MPVDPPPTFLDLPSCPAENADAVVLPLPLEATVSYGAGTSGGPRAILDASAEVETFDEETLVEFADLAFHTAEPIPADRRVEEYLEAVRRAVRGYRGRRLVCLGGEHTVTYGAVHGLTDDPERLTIVQVDAHADLAEELDGLRWSHGTVMRRLWERGCRLVQIGVRSLSRAEYELSTGDDRIATYFAHRLGSEWDALIETLAGLEGDVYLTFDVDGLDPSVIPSTGTPQPGGLSWSQAMDVLRAVTGASGARLTGADVVEYVPSPHPPGSDIVAARLVTKLLAYWLSAGA